jgi:hypothetical protein
MKCIILIVTLLLSAPTYAAKYTLQGIVDTLRQNVGSIDGDFITLKNVKQAGSCSTVGGLILVRILNDADRAFSIALAAELAGKELELSVDDNHTGLGGYCVLRWINVVN